MKYCFLLSTGAIVKCESYAYTGNGVVAEKVTIITGVIKNKLDELFIKNTNEIIAQWEEK
jgi:hypothetical protein